MTTGGGGAKPRGIVALTKATTFRVGATAKVSCGDAAIARDDRLKAARAPAARQTRWLLFMNGSALPKAGLTISSSAARRKERQRLTPSPLQ